MLGNVYLYQFDLDFLGRNWAVPDFELLLKQYATICSHVYLQCSAPLKNVAILHFIQANQRLFADKTGDGWPIVVLPLSRRFMSYFDYLEYRVDKISFATRALPSTNAEIQAYSRNNASNTAKYLDRLIIPECLKHKTSSVDSIFRGFVIKELDSWADKLDYHIIVDCQHIAKNDTLFQTFSFSDSLRRINVSDDAHFSLVSRVRDLYYRANWISLDSESDRTSFIYQLDSITSLCRSLGLMDLMNSLDDECIIKIRSNLSFSFLLGKFSELIAQQEFDALLLRIGRRDLRWPILRYIGNVIFPAILAFLLTNDLVKILPLLGEWYILKSLADPFLKELKNLLLSKFENTILADAIETRRHLKEFRRFLRREIAPICRVITSG